MSTMIEGKSFLDVSEHQLRIVDQCKQINEAKLRRKTLFTNDSMLVKEEEKIKKLHEKFVLIGQLGNKYISLDSTYDELSFSDDEIKIIRKRKDYFYLCTPKRALLNGWIIKELKTLFETSGVPKKVKLGELYDYLRRVFTLHSINRGNLRELLQCKGDVVTYEHLLEVEQKLNSALSSIGDLSVCAQQPHTKIVINDNLKRHIKRILRIETIGVSTKKPMSEDEQLLLQKLTEAVTETDINLCRNSFLYPKKAELLIAALEDYCIDRDRIDKLLKSFFSIPVENLDGKLLPLIKAYTTDIGKQRDLYTSFNGAECVNNLEPVIDKGFQDNNIYNVMLGFVNWLTINLKQKIVDGISSIYKDERTENIIQDRAKGLTLEEVGNKVGLTRERVRQIETKAERSFSSYFSRLRPHYILLAFSSCDFCINIDDIVRIYGSNADVVTYFLKKVSRNGLVWCKELNAFLVGTHEWYKCLLTEIDQLPAQIVSQQMDEISLDLKNKLQTHITENQIAKIIKSYYKCAGEIYSKKRISKREMYRIVFEKHYPNGMKLFDHFEMMRFKARLEDLFGDDFSNIDTQAISARITSFTILCDRGKYILPQSIKISPVLLDKLRDYIQSNDRGTILLAELFERFKDQLAEISNINNRYFLHGVLKYYFGDRFYFTRDTVSKSCNDETSIRKHIEDYIKAQQGSVTKDKIRNEFLGITEIVLSMTLSNNDDILQWGFGEYMHSSKINISGAEVRKIKQILDAELRQGGVSVKALFEIVYNTDRNLLDKNAIQNHFALYSLIQYLFPDDYEYNRPFINNCGVEGASFDAIIDSYISSFDELTISELKGYLEKLHIKVGNYTDFMDKYCADFLRVDEDLLVRAVNLSITDDVINHIQDSVLSACGNKGYLAAKNYDNFFFFPQIGLKWTPYLLVSFIKKYCPQLVIVRNVVDYRYLTDIIVKRILNIESLAELIRYAIKYENDKAHFKRIAEVELFLKEQGVIANSIPQFLFEKGFIVVNEFDNIIIN